MKLEDLKFGEEYAVRQGSYGPFVRMLCLGIEMIEVSNYRYFAPSKAKRRVARMRRLDGGNFWRSGLPLTGVDDEVFVPARDIHRMWAVQVEADRQRQAYEQEEERADSETDERVEALVATVGFPVVREGRRWDRPRSRTYVVIKLDDLEKFVRGLPK